MMHMTFYWGKDVTILFDFWRVTTWTWYLVSLVVVFLVSVGVEWLGSQRTAFSAKLTKGDAVEVVSSEDGDHRSPLLGRAYEGPKVMKRNVLEAFMYAVNVAVGYLLMLAAMSFNGGVFCAIVAGLTVGHLLYGGSGSGSGSACGM